MIILLDLDSTLVAEEWCDTLAHWKWVGNEVVTITKQTMDGTMDFDTAFPQKLELLSPSHQDLDRLGSHLLNHIDSKWKQTIPQWKEANIQVGILSQGYTRSSLKVAEEVWIDPERVFALHFNHNKDGSFHSLDMSQDLMFADGKRRIITQLKKSNPDKHIVIVGDSVSDMHWWKSADLFIAYAGVIERKTVIANTDHVAYTPHEVAHILEQQFSLTPLPK